MRPCRSCSAGAKVCQVGEGSEKCVECIRLGKTCDLAISLTTLKKIYSKRVRLRKEVREMRTKLLRLKRQLEFVEDKEEELATTE